MACLATSAAYAYAAQVGGVYYNFHGTEAEATYLVEDWENAEAYKGTLSISDVSKLVNKLLGK